MSQVSKTEGQTRVKQAIYASNGVSRFIAGPGLHLGLATCLFAVLTLFYAVYYPVHQDLAGSALSGRLAVTLGNAFREYAIYFPPVEKMWFSIAARLSDLTGLRLDIAVVALTSTAILFGAGLAYRIRRATVGASPFFFILSVVVLSTVPILFKNVFGLREHLVIAGLWPYLVLRLSDPDGTRTGRRLRAVLGVWMGATLLFKYLYSVVVLLVELTDALIQRRPKLLFRIENVAAGGVVFLYLFLWLGIDPAQRAVIAAMLSAIDAALLDPLQNGLKAGQNMFFAILLLVASRIFGVSLRETALAFAVTLGVVIAAWTQARWFSHHLFPITMAYILWWWIGAQRFRWWFNTVVALFILGTVAQQYLSTREYHERLNELEKVLELNNLSVAGKKVALLNAHPSPYNEYLASHDGLRWTPLMNNAYVAAELEQFDKPENVGKILPPLVLENLGRKMLHDQMLQLWEDTPPDVLIFDSGARWPLRYISIDWQQAFSKDQRFNAILKQYRPVLIYDGVYIKFEYYERAEVVAQKSRFRR